MRNAILFIFFIIIVVSCGNEPPVIQEPIYNILIYQSESLNNPNDMIFLSVYFILNDENGLEDISSVKIIHSETEYVWTLPENITASPTIWQEKTYIGFSFLEYDNAKSVLMGEYLIEVEDSAGNFVMEPFFVELEGLISSEPYKVPDIEYSIDVLNKNKEIKIGNDDYSSCEIKFLNDSNFFNGGRKKFSKDQKIILNKGESMPRNTRISVRVNKDDKLVYFLKMLVLE